MKSGCAPRWLKSDARRGATLAETMVSLALTSLMLVSLAAFLQAGSRYFLWSTTVTSLQKACVVATNALTAELLETSASSTDSNHDTHDCLVFSSPRNARNTVDFVQTNEMVLKWFTLVGYYVDAHNDSTALFRRERPIDETNVPPQGQPNTPLPVGPLLLRSYWQARPGSARLIAEHVYYLDTVVDDKVKFFLGLSSRDGRFQVCVTTSVKPRN